MNNRLSNKHNLFGKLGDFWYRQLSEDTPEGVQLARTITHLLDANHAVSDINVTTQGLAGTPTNIRNNFTIPFNPSSVKVVNMDLQERTDFVRPAKYSMPYTGGLQVYDLPVDPAPGATSGAADLMLGDDDAYTLLHPLFDAELTFTFSNNDARPLYYIPIPLNITPLVITTKNRELTLWSSFTTNQGYILFFEDPATLFPDNAIFCRAAHVTDSHKFDYTYQADNLYSTGVYVARYMRASHSPVALRLAIAEIAGLPIIKADSILQAIYSDVDNTIYEFDTEVIRVPLYVEHTALTVGTTYTAGTIIGEDYVRIYSNANTSATPAWYRHDDLNAVWAADGLPLSTLTPFGNIIVPDATGTFSTNGAPSGSTAHLKLSGVTGSSTGAYWAFIRESEIHTNRYMASCSGATAAATVNLVNFYFDNMLAYNSVVIKLRTVELGSERHQNVISFIQRDLPINVTPIILQ